MAKLIHIKVITQDGRTLSDEAVSVKAPAALGYLGVLYNHAPMVSLVEPGWLSWKTASGEHKKVKVGGGLMEVAKNHVTLLTDALTEVPLS